MNATAVKTRIEPRPTAHSTAASTLRTRRRVTPTNAVGLNRICDASFDSVACWR
jgi:hypothetical protein